MKMQVAHRDTVYTTHSRDNEPAITVDPGEEFLVETELCTGDWLRSREDVWGPGRGGGPNPAVCVAIRGAEPGMMLEVEIRDIEPDRLGYTGFNGRTHTLARRIAGRSWGLNTRTVRIREGYIEWSEDLRLPVEPMIGTLGTAPGSGSVENSRGGRHGGNMDVNEVTTGATVFLPVAVGGGLLHTGDVHARQGDGEINGAGGIECRAVVRMAVAIRPRPEMMGWIRIENERYLMSVSCEDTVEDSFCAATRELLEWIVADYNLDPREAYLLLGQVMEARATQFVNPTRTYICKVEKRYLEGAG